jgi:hypothetical protein
MTRREDYLGYRVSYPQNQKKSYYLPDGSQSSPSDTFESDVYAIFEEAVELLLSKHKDYGPKNIANAPGGALNGLRVRMHDKTARINHLIDNAKYKNPEHESLRDSFLDLANYAMIALLVIDGNWPNA